MKGKVLSLISLLLLMALKLSAQENLDAIKSEYARQVRYVGEAGVGVETILNRWEALAPDDSKLHVARFYYHFNKAEASISVEVKDTKNYLGKAPLMTLKDSLGKEVHYFEVVNYDDEAFANALNSINRAIELEPREFAYRFLKITSLMEYEKESPDIAAEEIYKLIEEYTSKSHDWLFNDEAADEDIFLQGIGEYCYDLFRIASPQSYDYFLAISTHMNKLFPDKTVFINNIGSWWKVVKNDNRKALKYYRKALKIEPDDYVATTNIRIIESSQSGKGRSSK